MSREKGEDQNAHTTAAQARASFERAVDSVDVGTANRLRLFRREALATEPGRSRSWLLPAGAVAATVAVLVLALAWRAPIDTALPPTDAIVEESPPLEFPSEDDAELYAWLGDAPVATPEGSAL